MAWRVLVTARAFCESGHQAEAALLRRGFMVAHSPVPGPHPSDELGKLLAGYDAVVASTDAYTAQVFAGCPLLKVVSRWGIGTDSVDLEAATAAGVVVTNTPGTVTEAVADHTLALILGISRRLAEGDALVRSGGWGELRGVLVWGKTLGLVGLGQIGQAVARRALGFAMQVLAHDPHTHAVPSDLSGRVELLDMDDLLARSDYVSLHAAVSLETRGLINARSFGRMKPTAYLINTARGALVDEAALLDALYTGRIAGAALDVYAEEPLPAAHPLRSAPNCLLSPHNAFNAIEAAQATSMRAAENVIALCYGEPGAAVVNPLVLNSPSLRLRAERPGEATEGG